MRHFKNIKNIGEYYGVDVKHPLIDIKRYEDIREELVIKEQPLSFDFYTISFVKNFNGFIQIGNTKFEGENGVLHFITPNETYTCNSTNPWAGYQVLIHPNIFKKHFTHKEIDAYDFFSYQVNESLLLTDKEEELIENILSMAWNEFNKLNDDFSVPVVLSYISTLLNLTDRFYARQFESRKNLNSELSKQFFVLLKKYYSEYSGFNVVQPTVQYFADKLNVTPNYLSDTIKHDSGKSALTAIHDFVIEKAKQQLQSTNKSVSEISYQLGFEYPNYFSRLFKKKTNLTPSAFRKSVKSI